MFLITVLISYGQWTYTNLSEPKDRMGAVVLGSKAYFGGGEAVNGNPLSTVEIYDVVKEAWESPIGFQESRMHPVGVACGTKIIFAGGGDWNNMSTFDNVDIYDTVTKQWTYEHLLVPRIFLSAISKGNKVLFAGGTDFIQATDMVEIYDISTGTWTFSTLSEPRSCMAAAVIGDSAFFAGGYNDAQQTVSDIVDIYNFTTGTWSTDVLSLPRAFLTAVNLGDVVLFAGGTDNNNESTDRVDIFNVATGDWTISNLSVPRALFPEPVAAAVCGKAYFVGGGHMDLYNHMFSSDLKIIDIYDPDALTWSVDSMTQVKIMYAVAGVTENPGIYDQLLIAGGYYGSNTSDVEIYKDCIYSGINPVKENEKRFHVYPNPCSDLLHFDISEDYAIRQLFVTITDLEGRTVYTQILAPSEREVNLNLTSGIYVLKVIAGEKVYSELITIQK